MSTYSIIGLIAFTILFLSLISYVVHTFITRSKEVEESLIKEGKLDEKEITTNKNQKYKLPNEKMPLKELLKGIGGQILFSSLGVIVWCLMYEFGYLVGIFGFFIMSFTLMGFKFFKRKRLPKAAFIGASIIGFLQIFIAEFLSLTLDVVFTQSVGFVVAFKHVVNWFLAGNIGLTIILDLGVGLVVAFITLLGFYIYNKYNISYKKLKKTN